MTRKRKSLAEKRIERFHRMTGRQASSGWMQNYEPAIRATRAEAPRGSQPTIIHPPNSMGRKIHLLSQTELSAALVALHFGVSDIHEQRILWGDEGANPLEGHPGCLGQRLPPLRGMWSAFERLGGLDIYPTITCKKIGVIGVPDILVGDLLLYIRKKDKVRCVNWTVKRASDQFVLSKPDGHAALQTERERMKAAVRHAAEELYYSDVQVPTYRITADSFPRAFVGNLKDAFGWCMALRQDLKPLLRHAVTLIRANLDGSASLLELGDWFCRSNRISLSSWRALAYSAIWHRMVPAEIVCRRILFDVPLHEQSTDVTEVYSYLFAGLEL